MNPFNKRFVLDAIDDYIEIVNSNYSRVNGLKKERDHPTVVFDSYLNVFKQQLEQLNDLKIYVSKVASDTAVNLTQDQFTLIQNFYQK